MSHKEHHTETNYKDKNNTFISIPPPSLELERKAVATKTPKAEVASTCKCDFVRPGAEVPICEQEAEWDAPTTSRWPFA